MVVKLSAVDTSSCHQALKNVTRVTAEKRNLIRSFAHFAGNEHAFVTEAGTRLKKEAPGQVCSSRHIGLDSRLNLRYT
jgi:hypothetical protein